MEDNKGKVTGTEQEDAGNDEEKKSYSLDEVQALIQKEADRRVTQAMSKQKKEYEKKLSLSGLDGEKREQAEKDNRIQELEDQLKEFKLIQTKGEMLKTLSARGLSADFADLIHITDDVEESQQRIDKLDKLFKKAVAEEVKKRVPGGTPKTGTGGTGAMTKETYAAMGWKEKNAWSLANPDEYKKLFPKQ